MMQIRIAKFFSYILHPLLMPTYFTALLLFASPVYVGLRFSMDYTRLIIVGFIFFFTLVFPLFTTLMLKRISIVKSLEMETTQERRLPFIITSACYVYTYYALSDKHLSSIFYIAMQGAIVALLLTMIINFKWKISAHMVGIGGFTGIFLGVALLVQSNLTYTVISLFLLSGILGFSRLKVGLHTPAQIYVGFGLGLFCQLIVLALYILRT